MQLVNKMENNRVRGMLRIVEWMWLVISAVSLFEVVFQWSVDRSRAYLFIAFSVIGLGMFFFRKRQRQKMEDRWKP